MFPIVPKHPTTNVAILTRDNYRVWSKAMVRHFDGLGVLEYLYPPGRSFVYDHTTNAKVSSSLAEHSSDSIVNEMFDHAKAHLIWSQLETVFGPTNTTMGSLAGTRLPRRRWVQGENPAFFLSEIEYYIADMRYYKINISDYELVSRFFDMIPIQSPNWKDFKKFVSPQSTPWSDVKRIFF